MVFQDKWSPTAVVSQDFTVQCMHLNDPAPLPSNRQLCNLDKLCGRRKGVPIRLGLLYMHDETTIVSIISSNFCLQSHIFLNFMWYLYLQSLHPYRYMLLVNIHKQKNNSPQNTTKQTEHQK